MKVLLHLLSLKMDMHVICKYYFVINFLLNFDCCYMGGIRWIFRESNIFHAGNHGWACG